MSEKNMKVLEAKHIKKYFPIRDALGKQIGAVKAVDDVSLALKKGETYGLVGESGCGKSTLGRSLLRLFPITEGEIFLEGKDISCLSEIELRPYRVKMQMIFQDPYTSLNPRKSIGDILEEVLKIHGMKDRSARMELCLKILEKVGLMPGHYYRYPHEFSGGQRQRIGIARALLVNPSLIICDEPVSALDVSIQAQIINLLNDLQQQTSLTYLFISHNMSVVRYISDRVGVMYLGHLMEEADTDELFSNPMHPYTKALLSAVPSIGSRKTVAAGISGEIPSPIHPPTGCVFHTRCPHAVSECSQADPAFMEAAPGHFTACRLYG
ncbi:oligopeptide/dipeptide ABC transporter ATP-binding protein [Clostridium sp. AM58-1XD]|uniref:ABC transporter ATP-binding protein n=1 Tax=Clostridium sp. AM58-1XD TaxID=2292307 RepID=UPI000E4ADF10|nr:oligopeptide/dipeptide ABC transporter ATP-binding protein [Clostridium sp. AM58-1XD]RGZ00114.1 ATP-binding cassette domain-containing protein [Clostridium sp. AM58-1XD]